MDKQEAIRYANRIRNAQKKAYALAWINYRFDNGPYVDRENYPPLSFMGEQAVRLKIGFPEYET
jgi:hypothetical protein